MSSESKHSRLKMKSSSKKKFTIYITFTKHECLEFNSNSIIKLSVSCCFERMEQRESQLTVHRLVSVMATTAELQQPFLDAL